VGPCEELITGFDGSAMNVLQKGMTKWGEAFYLPSCPLSSSPIKDGVSDGDYSRCYNFCRCLSGWSCLQIPDQIGWYAMLLAQRWAYCYEGGPFHRRTKGARMVLQLHRDLNHPSCDQLCMLLDSTCLVDTPLTAKDVRISERMY
jgi:hypothetical protein